MTLVPARELLFQNGIRLTSYAPGEHTAICPRCSAHRNKKRVECLDVRITADDRAYWKCHHCHWTGPDKGSGNGHSAAPSDRLRYFVYKNAQGQDVRRKVRNIPGREPKMWWQHWDGAEWVKGKGEAEKQLLYRFDEIAAAIKEGLQIAIAEGEKDVDSLWAIGIPATCSPDGASTDDKRPKWAKVHSEQLKGADVCVFQDNDNAGIAHANETVKQCLKVCKTVKRIDLAEHWP